MTSLKGNLLLILLMMTMNGTSLAQGYDLYKLPSPLNVYPIKYPMTTPKHVVIFNYDTLHNGSWLQFYELNDGTLRIARIWSVTRGKQVGKEYVFDLSGFVDRVGYFSESGTHLSSCIMYSNGQVKDSIDHVSGDLMSWYENGQLRSSSNDTSQTSWYPNGQKEIFRPVNSMGKIEGEVKYWDEDGSLRYLGEWKAGIPMENQLVRKRGKELKSTAFRRIPRSDRERIQGYRYLD